MKQFALVLGLILSLLALPANAAQPCRHKTRDQLIKALADAYRANALGQLDDDDEGPNHRRVKIVIEHSLLEGPDQFERRTFRTLEGAEQWLRSRVEEDGTPFRAIRPLLGCKRGLCSYDFDGGIDHNHLYLSKIAYGYRDGCPYIKTIFLLDGD